MIRGQTVLTVTQVNVFIKSLVENIPPEIPGEDVLHAMKAVFASIESSATGRAVDVK